MSSGFKAAWHKGRVLIRATYDSEADVSYFNIEQDIANGDSVEQYVIDRKKGMIVLDFDKKGRLLGVKSSAPKPYLQNRQEIFFADFVESNRTWGAINWADSDDGNVSFRWCHTGTITGQIPALTGIELAAVRKIAV